jgi:hypothetical protein
MNKLLLAAALVASFCVPAAQAGEYGYPAGGDVTVRPRPFSEQLNPYRNGPTYDVIDQYGRQRGTLEPRPFSEQQNPYGNGPTYDFEPDPYAR